MKKGKVPIPKEALEYIYAGVASGRALDNVLKDDFKGKPSPRHFWGWHMRDDTIKHNLACARLNGVEVHMEEAMSIADTPQIGEEVTTDVDEDGMSTKTKTADMLGHRKLQIETRIKRAQMIAPRKYGPSQTYRGDPEAPLEVNTSDKELARRLLFMVAKGDASEEDGDK